MFGVLGGTTGGTKKQIFTFTKSGAVPVRNGVFQLNTTIKKKPPVDNPQERKDNETNFLTTNRAKENEQAGDSSIHKIHSPCTTASTVPSQNIITTIPKDLEIFDTDYATDKIIIQITKPDDQTPNEDTLTKQDNSLTVLTNQHLEVHDDGYQSALSPGSSSNGEASECDLLEAGQRIPEQENTDGQIQYTQEFVVDNVINTQGFDFELVDEDSNMYTDDYYASDDSSHAGDDLSSKLIDKDKDPSWYTHNFELKKVAVLESKDKYLHQRLFPHNGKVSKKGRNTANKKTSVRHRRGPIPLSLEDIEDEERKKTIIRCREYRYKKATMVDEGMSELDQLQARNDELKLQAQEVKDKVKKLKEMYINLISEGRIKFC